MSGWLLHEDQREATPFTSKASGVRPVECAVIHWSASPARDYGERRGANEARMRSYLRGERGRSSVHFCILRDGTLLQSAPLTARTWHAGQSSWSLGAAPGEGRSGVNARSIGIELENVGPLEERGGRLVDSYGGTYNGPRPHRTRGEGLHEPFTRPQIEALLGLAGQLVAALPVLADGLRWVGHRDVSPGRKPDPGPPDHFPWRTVRAAVNRAARGQSVDPATLDWLREKGVCQ